MSPITLRSDDLQITLVYTSQDDGYIEAKATTDGGYSESKRIRYEKLHLELPHLISGNFKVIMKVN